MDLTSAARRLLDPVPVHRTFGLEVLWSGDGRGEVAVETRAPLANVVGALHASGLVTLVDAGGLAAILGTAEHEAELAGLLPLGAVATVRFLAPARGRLVGTCGLDDAARAALRPLLGGDVERTRLETTTQVHDADGVLVCEGTFAWSVRRTG